MARGIGFGAVVGVLTVGGGLGGAGAGATLAAGSECTAGSASGALLLAGSSGRGSAGAAGAGWPRRGPWSAAASACGSGAVEVRPTESVSETVIRSGSGDGTTDGGFQASQTSSKA